MEILIFIFKFKEGLKYFFIIQKIIDENFKKSSSQINLNSSNSIILDNEPLY